MAKGIIIHENFIQIFHFLNFKGYKECHYYHCLEETKNYQNLLCYYMEHYHKLLHIVNPQDLQIIPQNWFKYKQQDVDISTKRTALREMLQKWVSWEQETKSLLQQSYKQLEELGEIAAMNKLMYFLQDVDNELAQAEYLTNELETVGYDIVYIMDKQPTLCEEYQHKIKKIFEEN